MNSRTDARMMLGLAGVGLLIVGVFLPFMTLPLIGHINYFQNGKGDGVFILIFAGVSIYAILRRRFSWLWTTGGLCVAMVGFTAFQIIRRLNALQAETASKLGDKFTAKLLDSVQIDYGVGVLAVGIIFILVSAAYRREGIADFQALSDQPAEPVRSGFFTVDDASFERKLYICAAIFFACIAAFLIWVFASR